MHIRMCKIFKELLLLLFFFIVIHNNNNSTPRLSDLNFSIAPYFYIHPSQQL